ncbi:MAG: RNA ligase family protein [Agitococcus sp.]|nr:RNA ligase family protein [Agitococcus sp.]MDO9177149.1 RNA ligase family protein [Agitococcus sp.]
MSDDRVLRSLAAFRGKEVVVTLKMDGENTSLYQDGLHARSLDSRHHASRDWLAAFHAEFAHTIPADWRVCGENLFARHSIAYLDLPSYFLGFSVWDERNTALSWDDTVQFCKQRHIEVVPVLYRGPFDEALLRRMASTWDATRNEGFVVRLAGPIAYEAFASSVTKWVRPAHVQTNKHWMHQAIVRNHLHNQSAT